MSEYILKNNPSQYTPRKRPAAPPADDSKTFIQHLRSAGISIWLAEGRVTLYDPHHSLTDSQRAFISNNERGLVLELQRYIATMLPSEGPEMDNFREFAKQHDVIL